MFGFAQDTVEQRANVLNVFETALAQGVPVLLSGGRLTPIDTGYSVNPACCVREPETTQQENLSGRIRSSRWARWC